ncbi:MAG: bifunctional alpha/beta hydrolase/OsmC family protein [Gammaproteobacteria bacterium]|nr:bifunctional alpha/beta hydrolase/OsmC family protein [Gammaproteobacteria bacterium]
MASRALSIDNGRGDSLAAALDLPVDGRPRGYALFAHCFTCGKDLKGLRRISQALTARGIAVVRFDFTGLGGSGGEFAETTFSSNVDDLVAVARHMERELDAPQILVGHSLGGTAVLAAAGELPSVRAVATVGAPCDAAHVIRHFEEHRTQIEEEGEAEVDLGGRPFRIRQALLDDLADQTMQKAIRELRRALLIFHSPVDRTVGVDNAARIFQAAMHPKSFVSLDRADHLLGDPDDAEYVGTVIAAWATKYVDALAPRRREAAGEKRVLAHIGADGYVTELDAGGHPLLADEPAEMGGTDLGPSPYQLLNAALGACTAMTLRMYADRKNLPLEGVRVRLEHEKVHAKDCADCPQESSRVDVIAREILLEGDLDEAQRERLLEIADRCPVHRTLHEPLLVRSRLVDE